MTYISANKAGRNIPLTHLGQTAQTSMVDLKDRHAGWDLKKKITDQIKAHLLDLPKENITPVDLTTTAQAQAYSYPTKLATISERYPLKSAQFEANQQVGVGDKKWFMLPLAARKAMKVSGGFVPDDKANIKSQTKIKVTFEQMFSSQRISRAIEYYLKWKFMPANIESAPTGYVNTEADLDELVKQALLFVWTYVRLVSPVAWWSLKPLANEDRISEDLVAGGFRPNLVALERVAEHFGRSSDDNQGNFPTRFDLNEDGKIDIFDLVMAANMVNLQWVGHNEWHKSPPSLITSQPFQSRLGIQPVETDNPDN
jgi:hypothetical protein